MEKMMMTLHLTFPVFIIRKTSFLAIAILLFSSCTKDGSGHYKLDNAMYLTIQTGAKSYSTYGYTNTQVSDMIGGPEIIITYLPDSSGAAQVQALFTAVNQITSGYNTIEFTMGNGYADIYMSKPGNDYFGNYKDLIGGQTTNTIRIGNPELEFWLDKKGFSFTITKRDTHNGRSTMEGIFSGLLHLASDTSVTQTASGSFRAYVK